MADWDADRPVSRLYPPSHVQTCQLEGSDLAKLLDFKPKAVSYILYKQPPGTKYTTFQIPKRTGGQRTITRLLIR